MFYLYMYSDCDTVELEVTDCGPKLEGGIRSSSKFSFDAQKQSQQNTIKLFLLRSSDLREIRVRERETH